MCAEQAHSATTHVGPRLQLVGASLLLAPSSLAGCFRHPTSGQHQRSPVKSMLLIKAVHSLRRLIRKTNRSIVICLSIAVHRSYITFTLNLVIYQTLSSRATYRDIPPEASKVKCLFQGHNVILHGQESNRQPSD